MEDPASAALLRDYADVPALLLSETINCALPSKLRIASFFWLKLAALAGSRAISRRSTGSEGVGKFAFSIFLNCRFTRLRLTAFPIDFVVINPARESSLSPFATTRTASGCANDFPYRRTRLKSDDLVNRLLCFTRKPARNSHIHQKNQFRT